MAKATKATKAKKATKSKRASTGSGDALAAARAEHKRHREHVAGKLRHAHRAVVSIVDRVHADDAEGIAKLRRAVEHAEANARATKRGA
jgi:hypothetical protein